MHALCRRRRSWRVRGLLTLGVAALWLAGPWSVSVGAQATLPTPANPGDFPRCIEAQLTAAAAAAPGNDTVGGFQDPDTLLTAVWVCAGHYADRVIVPIGQGMLGGLVIIMIVWTGVGFMFSGELDLGSLLGTIFLAGLGFMALDNYFFASPAAVPWLPPGETTHGFVALFADQAVAWGDLIIGTADEDFQRAFGEARARSELLRFGTANTVMADAQNVYSEAQASRDPAESTGGWIRRMEFEARMLVVQFFHWGVGAILWAIGWMIYAQYVWGFFTLAVLTVFGPLFIPFLMITQLDFLFWGWVKAMINGVIYMLTASALYAATAMLLIAPLERMAQVGAFINPTDPGAFIAAVKLMTELVFEYVPLVIMALFAALKVNALSAMVVAGGGPPGSGLGSAISKAAAGARTAAGWAPAAAVGGDPLSTVTDRHRAKQAIDEANRRTRGSGPRPAERGPYRGDPLGDLDRERQRLRQRPS